MLLLNSPLVLSLRSLAPLPLNSLSLSLILCTGSPWRRRPSRSSPAFESAWISLLESHPYADLPIPGLLRTSPTSSRRRRSPAMAISPVSSCWIKEDDLCRPLGLPLPRMASLATSRGPRRCSPATSQPSSTPLPWVGHISTIGVIWPKFLVTLQSVRIRLCLFVYFMDSTFFLAVFQPPDVA